MGNFIDGFGSNLYLYMTNGLDEMRADLLNHRQMGSYATTSIYVRYTVFSGQYYYYRSYSQSWGISRSNDSPWVNIVADTSLQYTKEIYYYISAYYAYTAAIYQYTAAKHYYPIHYRYQII